MEYQLGIFTIISINLIIFLRKHTHGISLIIINIFYFGRL